MRTTIVTFSLLSLLAACGGSSTTEPSPTATKLLIMGQDTGPRYGHLTVSRNGVPVNDAVVSANGVPATLNNGKYSYDLGALVPTGAELRIRVEAGGDMVEGVVTVPLPATLLSPTNNQSWVRGSPLGFAWSASASPDWWRISLSYVSGPSGDSVTDSVSGTSRAASLVTTGIPVDGQITHAKLIGYLAGTFTGPAAAGSSLRFRMTEQLRTIVESP